MAKEDSVPVRINPGLCRFLGVEAKLFGCRKHPFVIGDELAKIGPELSGALEVDGVKGPDLQWQQHTSRAKDAVAHADHVDPVEDGSSSGQGCVALEEQRPEDFCTSESAGDQGSTSPQVPPQRYRLGRLNNELDDR